MSAGSFEVNETLQMSQMEFNMKYEFEIKIFEAWCKPYRFGF